MPEKLTEARVKALAYDGKPAAVRDAKVAGLLVAVNKTGKSYKIQRDLWQGQRGRKVLVKTVRHTLGGTEEMTLDDARSRAAVLLDQIKRGIDPNAPLPDPSSDAGGWTVRRMFEEYGADMRARDCVERSIVDMMDRLDRYLPKWGTLPVTAIKRSQAREEHRRITVDHGATTANKAMRDFRAAYNFALKVVDDPDALPGNPVQAVTFNKERASNRVLMPDDLADWWRRVQALPNPLRRDMHLLGLLSGLRPGTLVGIRRDWVRLDAPAVSIPRMKSGRSFDLPLSGRMVEVVSHALTAGDVLFPGSPWLFPSRSTKTGEVIATQVWKEKALPSETGHILRHTYRTVAQRAGIDRVNARLLLDHTVPGIDGVYIHERALFDTLLAEQERMTAALFALLEPSTTTD
ncbi:tyrosine-type recombinase/integrase [Roseicitreum antarcticum]|uniref:Site-specific recombinase XerD n=1 Tax=Roseicitreum antarcticum TaxID=564137 RepID=A0A1H2U6D6_9RHOB|nr:integrase family protein [Roseicitreum antarcticum]SDW51762.1 Site-specific recombinase XerD [Roseicitreum antarcticum]